MSPDPDAQSTEVYRGGRLHVRDAACDRCLFGSARLVDGARAREIVAAARSREGGSFICHRSMVSDEPPAICAVYFDHFAREDWVLRLAIAMDIVDRVTTGESNGAHDQLRTERLDAGEGSGSTGSDGAGEAAG
jgi:hypothetical protein